MKHRPLAPVVVAFALSACADRGADGGAPSGAPATTTLASSDQPRKPPVMTPPPRSAPRTARKPDPAFDKVFHTERCYLGLVALGFAKTAYEASLGAEKPGPKVPEFGGPPPKEGAKPRGPVNPAIVFQRLVRTCNAAAAAGSPEHEALDKALKAAADVGPPLGQALLEAGDYYAKGEHEKDSFAKGKELHARIKKGFEKLGEVRKAVAAALPDFRKSHAVKWESEPQKATQAVVEKGRAALELLVDPKTEAGARDAAIEAVAKAVEELEGLGKSLRGDPFVTSVPRVGKTFVEKAKAAAADRSPGTLTDATGALENVLEMQNNAYRRDLSGAVDLPPPNPHHGGM